MAASKFSCLYVLAHIYVYINLSHKTLLQFKLIVFNFSGITNDSKDPSVDTFLSTALPILKHFGVPSEGLKLKIESRGAPPQGGGEVALSIPTVQSLNVSFIIL